MKRILLGLMAVLFVGCANTDWSLQREAARSMGGVTPDSVKITNVQRGLTTVTWDAESSKGLYKCSADDMVRSVLCVKK